jgi:hypothetical protein
MDHRSGKKLRRVAKDNALASTALRLLETGQVIELKYNKQRLCLDSAHLPQQPAQVRHSQDQVNALACELPYTLGLPLSRLSVEEIRQHVISQGLVAEISGATLWRWLSSDALRPRKYRSWIFPRDPNFAEKPDLSSIFTNVSGRALHWVPMITSSAQTKRPVFKPAAENNRRCRRRPIARRTSSMSTSARCLDLSGSLGCPSSKSLRPL